jgi:hypothetical protein
MRDEARLPAATCASLPSLLPLDGRGRLRGDVVDHTINPAHLVDEVGSLAALIFGAIFTRR